MKKNLLLMMMCCPAILAAQNGVTISGLAIDAGTVTFNVSWNKDHVPTLWSDSVWVFVDYNNKGVMERLPLLSGATLTTTSPGGKVIEEPDNNKGVWVAGNARSSGSFSATVKLLTAVKNVGGACVYGSNYPPVGEYSSNDASKIVFIGTPEYDVALLHKSGTLVTTTTSSPLNVPAGFTVHSFTDKTVAPGKLSCIPSTVYELTASALSFCESGTGVTFALSGTESGRIYQLYKDGTTVVAALPGTGSAATFSDTVNEAGIYTARAVALPEYCPAVMTGSHTVSENAVPSIILDSNGGAATQIVDQNTPITTITYTASNATGISLSSGDFPVGVSGSASSNVYTISGTISAFAAVQTYDYTVTTTNNIGCTNATASGAITVVRSTPQYAASTKTWVYGELTWSDVINVLDCNKASFTISETSPDCRSYTTDAKTHYLYNWPYVISDVSPLCPSPWRVPTWPDFEHLMANTTHVALTAEWGVSIVVSAGSQVYSNWGALWSSTPTGNKSEIFWYTEKFYPNYPWARTDGVPVRCVK
jgi:hypothetical protein